MKKIFLLFLCFGLSVAFSDAFAQTTQNSTSSKDEFWGTRKIEASGTSADAVGNRASGLDTRFNTYEDGRRSSSKFSKKTIVKSDRMKEILKKEEKMHKKHRKDKRRLRRNRLR